MCAPGGLGGGNPLDPLGLFRSTKTNIPQKIESQPNPEDERKQAEAEATQRANAAIAERTRRRRMQQNTIALGGPTDTLGAGGQSDPYQQLTGQPGQVTGSPGRQSSNVMAGGAYGYGGGYGGGGGGGGYKTAKV